MLEGHFPVPPPLPSYAYPFKYRFRTVQLHVLSHSALIGVFIGGGSQNLTDKNRDLLIGMIDNIREVCPKRAISLFIASSASCSAPVFDTQTT
jgi:hypothetical protein